MSSAVEEDIRSVDCFEQPSPATKLTVGAQDRQENGSAVTSAPEEAKVEGEKEQLPDVSKIKPASKHEPVSKAEVEAFANRMDDIATILSDYLNEDPVEAAANREARLRKMNEVKAEALRQKMIDRYDPKRYVRFESDELINKLLAEADLPNNTAQEKQSSLTAEEKSLMTPFEKLSLEEATRQKEEGNTAFRKGDHAEAHRLYSLAIALDVLDKELCLALHNNRSQVNLLLHNYVQALEDATVVLAKHPHNTKALLRRATALSALHRPHEALVDLDAVARGDPKNVEAKKLRCSVELEKKEMDQCFFFEQSSVESAKKIQELAVELKGIAEGPFFSAAAARSVATSSAAADSVVMKQPADAATAGEGEGNANCSPPSLVSSIPWNSIMTALQATADRLVDIGSATLFRIHGGLAAVESVVRSLAVLLVQPTVVVVASNNAPEEAGRDVNQEVVAAALSCAFRVFAGAYKSHVATALVTDADAQQWIQLCARFFHQCSAGVSQDNTAKNSNKQKAVASSQKRIAVATLQLLEVLALQPRFASLVARAMTDVPLSGSNNAQQGARSIAQTCLSSPASDPLLFFGTRLWDAILREPSVVEAHFSETDFGPSILAGLVTPSMAYQEAAIALLLRVTVAQPQKAAALLSTPRLVMPMVLLLQDILRPHATSKLAKKDDDEPIASSAMTEGILAVLYNKVLQAPEGRSTCVAALEKDYRLFTFLIQSLQNYQVPTDVHVLSRLMGLIGKALSAASAAPNDASILLSITEAAVKLDHSILWEILSQQFVLATAAAVGRQVPAKSSSSSLPPKGQEAELAKVSMQCLEHTSLCLAVLYSNKHVAGHRLAAAAAPPAANAKSESSPSGAVTEVPPLGASRVELLLRILPQLSSQPIALGNVSLMLSCFPVPQYEHIYERANAVDAIIAALIAIRGEIFELERAGAKDTAVYGQSKSAQKNLAIALSKCCGTEKMQETVRSKRGFEVLYAALDRNPDGTIKDEK